MVTSDGPDSTQHYDVELLYYVELFSQLFIKDDIIFINFQEQDEDTYNLIFGSTCKILVPDGLKKDIIISAHSSKMCGHFRLKQQLVEF